MRWRWIALAAVLALLVGAPVLVAYRLLQSEQGLQLVLQGLGRQGVGQAPEHQLGGPLKCCGVCHDPEPGRLCLEPTGKASRAQSLGKQQQLGQGLGLAAGHAPLRIRGQLKLTRPIAGFQWRLWQPEAQDAQRDRFRPERCRVYDSIV